MDIYHRWSIDSVHEVNKKLRTSWYNHSRRSRDLLLSASKRWWLGFNYIAMSLASWRPKQSLMQLTSSLPRHAYPWMTSYAFMSVLTQTNRAISNGSAKFVCSLANEMLVLNCLCFRIVQRGSLRKLATNFVQFLWQTTFVGRAWKIYSRVNYIYYRGAWEANWSHRTIVSDRTPPIG